MGSVQHYFATKAELVQHACQLFLDRATQQHEATGSAPATERIANLLTMGIPDTQQQRSGTAIWHEFVIAGVTDPTIAAMITHAWQQRHHDLVELLSDLDPHDKLSRDDLADLLASTADGLALRATLGDVTRQDASDQLRAQLTALSTPPQ